MKKHSIALFICFAFAVLCFFSVSGFKLTDLKYNGSSITSDEVPHITSGYYYLKSGRYFLNPEHPPFVKDISALLTRLILNPSFPQVSDDAPYPQESEKEDLFFKKNIFPKSLEIENYQWDNRMLIFNPENNPDLIILLSRLSVIIFNSTFLFILYLLLAKSFDKRSATISIFLIATSQFSIAHASLVTTDFTASTLSMSALVAFSAYLKKYTENKTGAFWFILSALFFAAAFLSKFSALILIPTSFLGGLIYLILTKNNWKKILSYIGRFAAIIALSMVLVFSFYSLHTINSDADGIKSQIQRNYSSELPLYGKDLLIKMAEGGNFNRAIATYGIGLSMTINRINSAGQSTYFLEKVYGSEGAGYWYFPILYLTKLPLPFLAIETILLLLVIYSFCHMAIKLIKKETTLREQFKNHRKLSALSAILAVFIVIYAKNAIAGRLNIGLRHFMPVIFASALLTAMGTQAYWNKIICKNFKVKYAILGLSVIMTISVLMSFPHYLSYYNIIGGGTNNGYKIATDSNYDWGQDIKRLGGWMKENKAEKIYTDIFSLNAPKYYLGENYRGFNIKYDNLPPSGSYIAVSAMNYQNNIHDGSIASDKKYSILKDSLIGRAGKSIFIFKIP